MKRPVLAGIKCAEPREGNIMLIELLLDDQIKRTQRRHVKRPSERGRPLSRLLSFAKSLQRSIFVMQIC